MRRYRCLEIIRRAGDRAAAVRRQINRDALARYVHIQRRAVGARINIFDPDAVALRAAIHRRPHNVVVSTGQRRGQGGLSVP